MELDVLLARDLLVKLVELGVKICILFVEFLVVVYEKLLLTFTVCRNRLLGELGLLLNLGFRCNFLLFWLLARFLRLFCCF